MSSTSSSRLRRTGNLSTCDMLLDLIAATLGIDRALAQETNLIMKESTADFATTVQRLQSEIESVARQSSRLSITQPQPKTAVSTCAQQRWSSLPIRRWELP